MFQIFFKNLFSTRQSVGPFIIHSGLPILDYSVLAVTFGSPHFLVSWPGVCSLATTTFGLEFATSRGTFLDPKFLPLSGMELLVPFTSFRSHP